MAVLLEKANSEFLSADAVPYSQLGGNGLTFMAWFRAASAPSFQWIIATAASDTGERHGADLQATSSRARANSASGGTSGSSIASSWALDAWHHIAAVFAGSASRVIYLDGIAGGENTVDLDPATLVQLQIGANGGTSPFDGRLAHAAIWKRALSAAEINGLARGVSPRRLPVALWAYLPLLRDARDEVGNATWTENGTIAYDQKIHPIVGHSRLGLYGGTRPGQAFIGTRVGGAPGVSLIAQARAARRFVPSRVFSRVN